MRDHYQVFQSRYRPIFVVYACIRQYLLTQPTYRVICCCYKRLYPTYYCFAWDFLYVFKTHVKISLCNFNHLICFESFLVIWFGQVQWRYIKGLVYVPLFLLALMNSSRKSFPHWIMLPESCYSMFGKSLTTNLMYAVKQVLHVLNTYEIGPRINLWRSAPKLIQFLWATLSSFQDNCLKMVSNVWGHTIFTKYEKELKIIIKTMKIYDQDIRIELFIEKTPCI